MRIFDQKFGTDFLAGVPPAPGIYRMYDGAGALLYVGKARNLRRRLGQYRTARRTKRDRKRRALVRSADRLSVPRHSLLYTFRRLPRDWPELWKVLFRGISRVALEQLSLRLLDHDGACARSAAIHADLRAVERFFEDEASTLARAIAATGYVGYPVPQRERDALFLRYRALPNVTTAGAFAAE